MDKKQYFYMFPYFALAGGLSVENEKIAQFRFPLHRSEKGVRRGSTVHGGGAT